MFVSVVNSTKARREKKGKIILEQLKVSTAYYYVFTFSLHWTFKNNLSNMSTNVPNLVNHSVTMSRELLQLCDYPVKDDATKTLSMAKHFPALAKLVPSPLIIPLQESMIVNLPATSGSNSAHQPFPPDAPTIAGEFRLNPFSSGIKRVIIRIF